jgi:hypothetical protein
MGKRLIETYMVNLHYETSPTLDGDALLGELRQRTGRVERQGEKDDFYLYSFPDYVISFADSKVCVQVFLTHTEKGRDKPNVEEALQQSWSWREARQTVAPCRTSLLLSDFLSRGLEYRTRLELFQNALESVLTLAPCNAIHWIPSQQFVNPSAYLSARNSVDFHPLRFALNVRFFNVTNGQEDEMLMDTMGLGTLGLPDLQCHFLGLDPKQVAQVLYNTAFYIFDNGDIIHDGNTVQGIRPGDKWRCQHEMALAQPEREVIDVNPGRPHAAGKRK